MRILHFRYVNHRTTTLHQELSYRRKGTDLDRSMSLAQQNPWKFFLLVPHMSPEPKNRNFVGVPTETRINAIAERHM